MLYSLNVYKFIFFNYLPIKLPFFFLKQKEESNPEEFFSDCLFVDVYQSLMCGRIIFCVYERHKFPHASPDILV